MMSADILVIPKDNDELSKDIKANKSKYMQHIVKVFKKLVKTNPYPEKISLFKFRNTNLEVIVKSESYIPNLNNLLDFYIELEEYENCKLIKEIINKIDNMNSKDANAKQD